MALDPPQYYVSDGVRRSIAAREHGIGIVPAILKQPGKPDKITYVSIDQLHSPKKSVSAADPRYQKADAGMSNPAGRAKIPPIEIEPLGIPGQAGSIPLKDVDLDL